MAMKDESKILIKMRKRYKAAYEACEEQYREAMEDMKFATLPGYQWDENQKIERGKRPRYEFNKIRVTGKRIINSIRNNRPSGKVRAVEGGDTETANINEGLIRNIWNRGGDNAVDYACEYQTFGGMGAWRVTIDEDTKTFNKDLAIETIPNPFCLFRDPGAKDPIGRDADYWILTEKITQEEFETTYPDAKPADFEAHEFDDDDDWGGEEIRIAEYWWKEPYQKEIWKVSGPQGYMTVDSESDEAAGIPSEAIEERKTVQCDKIMMCIASGDSILEGPVEWAGQHFPFVQIFGEYYIIDGKIQWNGITRFAKDAQRSYNVSRTAITESIMMNPLEFHWATPEQAEGHEAKWKEAHQKNFPFRLYNADPQAGGPPSKSGGANIPVALINEAQMAAEEINMVTGIYQGDIGAPNQATSGRQEIARQNAGNIATFNYQDNAAKGAEWTWTILLDMIPHVYDTERELRILGDDGKEDYLTVNTVVIGEDGVPVRVNDLSAGKYDVVISVGPNFHTQRQEAAETYQAMLQGNPELFPIIGDLVMKSLDYPYAEEIAERVQAILDPRVAQTLNQDQELPPEAQMALQQAEAMMQQAQEAAQQIQAEKADTELEKQEVKQLRAELQTVQAQFEAKIAKKMADVEKAQADLVKKSLEENTGVIIGEAAEEARTFTEAVSVAMGEALQGAIGELSQMTAQAIADILEENKKRPRVKRIVQVRGENGLEAIPEYEEPTIQ